MSKSTWKNRERQISNYFGGKGRMPLSGKNSGHGAGDIRHDFLCVEHKHRQRHAVVNLWDEIRLDAIAEGKTPVVTLSVKGRKGFWVMCHSDDLLEIANQRAKASMEE